MATNTYVSLQTQVLGSAAASVQFNSIPQGYTDLVIVMSAKITSGGATNDRIQLGSAGSIDTTSSYSTTNVYGTGSAAGSYRLSNDVGCLIDDMTSSSFTINQINIMNYSNATTFKSIITRSAAPNSNSQAFVGLWRKTTAVDTIKINAGASTFAAGSTFTVYGIASLGATAKATGGMVTSDDTYIYHTFLASGTFTPTQSLSCDYLVIAGGGSGGRSYSVSQAGGGGGAGGLLAATSYGVTATPYTVTIGAGGASVSTQATPGNYGSNSVFGAITATGGGRGGESANQNGALTGGSGGGGGGTGGGNTVGGSPVAGQGYAGGNGYGQNEGGGGGGAGGAGFNGNWDGESLGGTGGPGLNYSAWASATGTGASGYYAGGGAGSMYGSGGIGGGGNSTPNRFANASPGQINTGSGGGGAPGNYALTTGAGGSGIVIIRYPKV